MADARKQAWQAYQERDKYEDARNLAANPDKWFEAAHAHGFTAGYDAAVARAEQAEAEVDRLRALLGEALTALRHVETGPDMWLDCCRNAIAPVLAKLAQEGLS